MGDPSMVKHAIHPELKVPVALRATVLTGSKVSIPVTIGDSELIFEAEVAFHDGDAWCVLSQGNIELIRVDDLRPNTAVSAQLAVNNLDASALFNRPVSAAPPIPVIFIHTEK